MPYNGMGTFSLVAGNPVVSGTTIQSVAFNNTMTDLAAGLSLALTRDGQAALTGNLNAGGQSITNGLNATFSGTANLGNVNVTAATIPANGVYLPAANTLGLSSASTQRVTINATGAVTINPPTSGTALTITAAGTATAMTLQSGAGANAYITYAANGTAAVGYIGVSGAAGGLTVGDNVGDIGVRSAFSINFAVNGSTTRALQISANGSISQSAPTAAVTAFNVQAQTNAFAALLSGANVSNSSYGLAIRAGTSNIDQALTVQNVAATQLLGVYGDGGVVVGAAAGGSFGAGALNTGTLYVNGLPVYAGSPINAQGGSYTAVASDANRTLLQTAAGAHTFAVPANGTIAYPVGTLISFINAAGAGALTLSFGDTLVWASTGAVNSTRTLGSGGSATAIKANATTWYISGSQLS